MSRWPARVFSPLSVNLHTPGVPCGHPGSGLRCRRVCSAPCAVRRAVRLPDVAHLGPVLQEPAVGHLVLPAHVPGVLPQQPDLVAGVPSVPQGISEMLPWTCLRLHSLDNDMSKVTEQNARTRPPGSVGS